LLIKYAYISYLFRETKLVFAFGSYWEKNRTNIGDSGVLT